MTRKSFRTLIIMCWVVLLVCVVIKLFGGNWFEFATDNQHFIQFCNYVENTQYIRIPLYCIISCVTTYPALCVFMNKKHLSLKETILFFCLITIKSVLGWYVNGITFIFDLITLILLPMLLAKFKNWKRVLIGNVLVMVFQLVSIFVRNMSIDFIYSNSTLFQLMFLIDYYVMIVLYYLYDNYIKIKKKEGK